MPVPILPSPMNAIFIDASIAISSFGTKQFSSLVNSGF
jgi:hypothetical protein